MVVVDNTCHVAGNEAVFGVVEFHDGFHEVPCFEPPDVVVHQSVCLGTVFVHGAFREEAHHIECAEHAQTAFPHVLVEVKVAAYAFGVVCPHRKLVGMQVVPCDFGKFHGLGEARCADGVLAVEHQRVVHVLAGVGVYGDEHVDTQIVGLGADARQRAVVGLGVLGTREVGCCAERVQNVVHVQPFVEVALGLPVSVGVVLFEWMDADGAVVGGVAAVSGVDVYLEVAHVARLDGGHDAQCQQQDCKQSFHGAHCSLRLKMNICPARSVNTTVPLADAVASPTFTSSEVRVRLMPVAMLTSTSDESRTT